MMNRNAEQHADPSPPLGGTPPLPTVLTPPRHQLLHQRVTGLVDHRPGRVHLVHIVDLVLAQPQFVVLCADRLPSTRGSTQPDEAPT